MLHALLKPLAMKKADIAAAVSARPETLSRWLSGKHVPSGRSSRRLLTFLNRPENLKRLGRRKPVTFEELFTAEPLQRAS